jgi:hypothetical protein
MDLKDFQNVNHEESVTVPAKNSKKTSQLVDNTFHDESDKIIKELEARIAAINKPDTPPSEQHTDSEHGEVSQNTSSSDTQTQDDTETVVVPVGEGSDFVQKIRPFILPIFLTIFALIFAAIFMYFFSKSRVEKSAQAIVNNQSQPEVIVVKETKPEVKEVVVIPEKTVPECDQATQYLDEEKNECVDLPPKEEKPVKPVFENGTTTIVKVRFAYDKYNYDNYPRGIYLLADQIFEGEYEDYKIIPTSRPYANDMFFGIDRYMVSLIGACQYVVDEADILVANMQDSTNDQVYSAIKDKYFRGNVVKILESSKPHVVCGK